MELVDDWYIYDNSESYYELIAKCVNAEKIIINFETYFKILHHDSE